MWGKYHRGTIQIKLIQHLIFSCLLFSGIGWTAAAYPETASCWKEFKASCCSMKFPAEPEHLSETVAIDGKGRELKYDIYISKGEQQTLFILLVAQYPEGIDAADAQRSFDGFLKGILTHHPDNQILSADPMIIDGNKALDFLIRTKNLYFKGRAVMIKSKIYLMGMECEIPHYNENRYTYFVTSFKQIYH